MRNQNNFSNLGNPDFYYNGQVPMNVIPINPYHGQDFYRDVNHILPNSRQERFDFHTPQLHHNGGHPVHYPYYCYPPEYPQYYPQNFDVRQMNPQQYPQLFMHQNPQQQLQQQQQQQQQQQYAIPVARSELYKTQYCRNFSNEGTCKYGDMCQFSHGASEIRQVIKPNKSMIQNQNNSMRKYQRGNEQFSQPIRSLSPPVIMTSSTSHPSLPQPSSAISSSIGKMDNKLTEENSPPNEYDQNVDRFVDSFQNIKITSDHSSNNESNSQSTSMKGGISSGNEHSNYTAGHEKTNKNISGNSVTTNIVDEPPTDIGHVSNHPILKSESSNEDISTTNDHSTKVTPPSHQNKKASKKDKSNDKQGSIATKQSVKSKAVKSRRSIDDNERNRSTKGNQAITPINPPTTSNNNNDSNNETIPNNNNEIVVSNGQSKSEPVEHFVNGSLPLSSVWRMKSIH